ncbi:MAG: sulfotransferase family protein [Actinomycetes bacterium]
MAPERWPDFLVIGAYKSGTTSVHHVLRAHPEVFVPERKEPNFFAFVDDPDDQNPAREGSVLTEADYRALFAAGGSARAVGEVSPEYMLNPSAAPSIARRIPTATLLAVLRNPVDRAFSDWVMYVREGQERETFSTALQLQTERRRDRLATGNYLAAGDYATQLEPYLRLFGSGQVHIWLYDDLAAQAEVVYAEMYAAIGVDPSVPLPAATTYNPGEVPSSPGARLAMSVRRRVRASRRPLPLASLRARLSARLEQRLVRPTMEPAAREQLVEHYRPGVQRLQDLIDRDLSHWLSPSG